MPATEFQNDEQQNLDATRKRLLNVKKSSVIVQRRQSQWFENTKPKHRDLKTAVICFKARYSHHGQQKTWVSTVKPDVEPLGLQYANGARLWKQTRSSFITNLFIIAVHEEAQSTTHMRSAQPLTWYNSINVKREKTEIILLVER